MDDTLHGRIEAELDKRTAELPALYRLPGLVVEVDACTCYGGTLPQGHEPGCGTEPGPLWFALDELGRFYAAARRILARHQLYIPQAGMKPYCDGCGHTYNADECPDKRDLADSLGLSTTTSEEHHG